MANNSIWNTTGLSSELLSEWYMLAANKKAYKRLQAIENGTAAAANPNALLSDRLYNDYFDNETGKIVKATYSPDSASTPSIDEEASAGDVLQDMRTLALAAINNPSSLTSTHYDFFEKMRQSIASSLVTTGGTPDEYEVVVEEATTATLKKTVDFHLLVDDQTFTVAGNAGEKEYSFGVGTSLEDVVAAINADSAETGVSVSLKDVGDGSYTMTFTSAEEGADQFIRIDQEKGDLFANAGSSVSARGTDEVTEMADVEATGDDTQAAIAVGVYTGKLFEEQSFTIQGARGSVQLTFAAGTTVEDMVAAINAASETTGITAQAIYGSDGVAEGFGLLADRLGSGNYVQVTQHTGDLFAKAGKTVSVAGSSASSDSSNGPAITSLSDLGQVNIDGVTYSFADLAPGGKASLQVNPDAALAVLDQALKDIYAGRAVIDGFDPMETYIPGLDVTTNWNDASTNTLEIGNYGSSALTEWLNKYVINNDS